MARSVRIGLVGDVMLGRNVDRRATTRDPEAVWGDLLDRLRSLDGLLVNLECCLSTRGEKWSETYRPFHFRASPDWATEALAAAGVDFACLANNHLMDYGEVALRDTLETLDEAGIAHAGAGETMREAARPAVFEVGDLTVAAVAFTDNIPEYAAGPSSPGVARVEADLSDRESRETVTRALDAARESDPALLVASVHLGPNMVAEPDPERRAFAQWLAESGVDVVHGHSAHVFQGVEVYDGRTILHDAGDFVDDYAVDEDFRNDRSFLFEMEVTPDGRPLELRLVPIQIADCAVHRPDDRCVEWCCETMRERSEPFGSAEAFERDGRELVLDLAD
ncbi:poly-gamma-glutamate biosynthesis protein [Halobacteriales archaeon QS_8_69_26]|nr:MAG: poly-gamma-glutamate biosynthesis protein [Halobacteriales archaeon QS_8_69_26]